VISLERRDGRPLRIGHRGAATLAPENTLPSFRAALETGVDLIEFDVIAGPDGGLVVAHSRPEMQDETPTLDEVLRFFVDEAPDTGVHVDLKEYGREKDVIDALRRTSLVERSFVSSSSLRAVRRVSTLQGPPVGITIPRGVFGISDTGRTAPVARGALKVLRLVTPYLIRPVLAYTRAASVVMHHTLVSTKSVRAAHLRGAPVVTWTVDARAELARVVEAGVDAVVTNDPRIFAPESVSTLSA
jgi:glycerophosphoryl diester phosphodiesterase